MKDKVILTPELAPIFTSKEDELQKILGMVTRILDGHGFENDSGAHGHRRYGDTMFVWIGAAVEIPYRVWKVLGTLGHKIYFFRPELSEKTVEQLKDIAKSNNFEANFKEIEDALLEYLKVFDAAPDTEQITRDKSGIIKIKWSESEAVEDQQDKAIKYIAEVSKLLAHLRGTVYISETKSTRRRYNDSSYGQYHQQSNLQQSQLQMLYSDLSYQIDGPDYDTDLPIIEDPSRAVILLRNLAIGHAVSQGRDSIRLEDVPIAIKVALSTAMYNRIKVFDLLLKNNGELTTSDITKGLRISEPTARRTMREFHALKIADISAITEYATAELKITLRSEYNWFKTDEFKELREDLIPNSYLESVNVRATKSSYNYSDRNTINLSDKHYDNTTSISCDAEDCHTLKVNSPPDTDKKNNSIACDIQLEDRDNSDSEAVCTNTNRNKTTDDGVPTTNKEDILHLHTSCDNNKIDTLDITEKNNARAWGSDDFQHVTPSHCHTILESAINPVSADTEDIAFEQILSMIKAANGPQVALSSCIISIHSRNEQIRNYLGDNLTSRDNRKVRNLSLKIIRHHNIEVVKYKPQLVVRWVEANSSGQSRPRVGDDNSANGGDLA